MIVNFHLPGLRQNYPLNIKLVKNKTGLVQGGCQNCFFFWRISYIPVEWGTSVKL